MCVSERPVRVTWSPVRWMDLEGALAGWIGTCSPSGFWDCEAIVGDDVRVCSILLTILHLWAARLFQGELRRLCSHFEAVSMTVPNLYDSQVWIQWVVVHGEAILEPRDYPIE